MHILGVSCYYHNSAAVLLKNGAIVAAAEEERFTRIKHDSSFPSNAIRFCLELGRIKTKDLDFIIFHEKPFLKFTRILKTILSTYPKSCNLFGEIVSSWFKDKLWVKARLSEFLDIPDSKILFCQHHLSHASSAFLSSPFEEAAILTVDGVGEEATTTLGVGKASWAEQGKSEVRILEKITFPHSLGLLYSVFTSFLGFKVNNGEYKVMGMSAFGKPRYLEKMHKLIKINSDGSFKLNMQYFSFHYSTKYSFNSNFIKLFGKSRRHGARFILGKNHPYCSSLSATDEEIKNNQYFADIAASIQKLTEKVLIKIANYLYQKTKCKQLCIAGGVALNCVVNYKILQNTPFKELFIQPQPGDGGAALGAALYAWHCMLGKKRSFIFDHVYWGKSYSHREIKEFLDQRLIAYREFSREDQFLKYVVRALLNQKVIGWFQGRFEWGPRALGNRSILADPRHPKMKRTINSIIKFREPFRPFAPSVLEEFAEKIFDIKEIKKQYPFKFMLYAVPIKKNLIPAATHIDNTARIQLLKQEDNPLYYKLIKNFYKKTGVPALLNTSFNLKGEAIVNSPFEAYETFKKSQIDMLVMDKFIVEKHKNYD